MLRISLRIVVFSIAALALAAPVFAAYNVVNTSWTVQCIFSPTCSVTVTDYVATFPVSGGSGNGRLQSRIFQSQDGRWVYEYRINMTQVAGITYFPYADSLAIYNWGTPFQYDFNSDGIATDHVFNITSGGCSPCTKTVTAAYVSAGYTYLSATGRVYAGSFPGNGESTYFFGLVSDQAPVLRTVWVHLDTGWVSMTGYAPPL
jgi:hypothetical protein